MNYWERFSRNIGILTKEEQGVLRNSKVSVAGLGGVGGVQAVYIARAGIGKMAIADPEKFEYSDINRQYGATESTIGKKKAEVMAEILRDINPEIDLEVYPEGITEDNINEFLEGAKVAIDAIEYFAPKTKRLFFDKCKEKDIPVISAPIVGYRALIFEYTRDSWDYEDVFGERTIGRTFRALWPPYMDVKIFQEIREGKPFPTFGPTSAVSGGIVAAETVFLILGKKSPLEVPRCKYIDTLTGEFKEVNLKDF